MQCGFFRRTKLDELAKLKAVEVISNKNINQLLMQNI